MQIPKLMGSPAGSGELLELAEHIFAAAKNISWLSLFMGLGALVLIRTFKKLAPKFPMAIVIMALGVLSTVVFHVDEKGVVLLQSVERGLPSLVIPDFGNVDLTQAAGRGLMVAVVIMAETLLAENTFAFRNDYKLNDRQEILACAAGNIVAAAVGCCPVNGSISRTSLNEQYGGKSQAVSITAGITMALILLFGTGFIGYLPVPVLTAIVISALMDVVETHLGCTSFQSKPYRILHLHGCRFQCALSWNHLWGYHWYPALFRSCDPEGHQPPRSFRGMIHGEDCYFDLSKNRFCLPY